MFHVQNLKIHGGSNRYFIKKKNNKIKINLSVNINRDKEIKYGEFQLINTMSIIQILNKITSNDNLKYNI